ncbi:MAG: sigma-54 dependent transcriptional regulator [Acidobacteriota bacterium]
MIGRLLLVEDGESQRQLLERFLTSLGYDVQCQTTAADAISSLRTRPFDLVLTDLRLGEASGVEIVEEARRLDPQIPVIIMTAFGTVSSAVEAVKIGAYDFLEKPLDLTRLDLTIARALERRELAREIRELRQDTVSFNGIVSESENMKEVLSVVSRAARTDVSVLLRGESGTGKEVIARAIHANSRRREAAFVAVALPALAEGVLESELFGHEKGAFTGAERRRTGRFEQAQGGTLFLDEIGDIPISLQVKLLRVLQERTFERVGSNEAISCDLRIVAATNRNLEKAVEDGHFREDLYYRLNVLPIHIPPLRQRIPDVLPLAEVFLARYAAEYSRPVRGFSVEAKDLLLRYHYSGNVRELQNIVERAVVLSRSDLISPGDCAPSLKGKPAEPPPPATLPHAVADLEQIMIARALARHDGNQTKAARYLGISERVLRYKLRKGRDR